MMQDSFVIAEAGSCHDGSILKAMELVRVAKDEGASAVKFQYWSSPDRLADRRNVPERYREIYRRYRMPVEWLSMLYEQCDGIGIEFMCTTYLPEDIEVVAPFVKRFKIASFEAGDAAFVDAHPTDRHALISLGMSDGIPAHIIHHPGARLLHCVSAYPAPVSAMNLRVLRWQIGHAHGLKRLFSGLSDHSRHPFMGALAVAAGAEIIEAHLRLEDTDPQNPDYATAFTPTEFADYVQAIRFAEIALGDGEKRVQSCELPMTAYKVRP